MLIICANDYKGKSLAGFMRFVSARLFSEYEQRAFRTYVTDAVYAIANNTVRFAGGTGIDKRFADIVYAESIHTANDQDVNEIIDGIIKRAGLGVEKDE